MEREARHKFMSELTPHSAVGQSLEQKRLSEGFNSQTDFVLQSTSLKLRRLSAH
jgi:hypothetical protein